MPDFSIPSTFDKDANYSSVKFGSNAKVLEVELNEVQNILVERDKEIARHAIGSGFITKGTTSYSAGTFTLNSGSVFVADGNIIDLSASGMTLSGLVDGDIIYMDVWEQEVNYLNTIKKTGNQQSTNLTNKMLDSRIGSETSRRMQIQCNLTKTNAGIAGHTYITLGTITVGAFVDQRVLVMNYLTLTGGTMTGDITLKGDPTANLHPVTKQYADGLKNSHFFKEPCCVATTANITLSGTQTIDGVAVAVGDRVLVKNQTTASQNGIYVVASGAWTRSIDFDAPTEVAGAYVSVKNGTANADTLWNMTTDGAITIGTTGLTFTQMNGLGQVTVGTGITKTGNNLALTSGVATVGTYKSVTVDTYGRVTAGTNPTTLGGYGITDALALAGGTMTGDITLKGDPTANLHPASKQYADAIKNGNFFKEPCRVATTANITLSGTQTIDGVALVAGERVLVKNQTTGSQNGIYMVSTGAWSRSADFDNPSEVSGAYIPITEGTANGDSLWAMATHGVIVIDTTSISFTQMNGLGQVTAGTGLTKTGNQLALTSGVATAGTYKSVTVDTYGRVTAGTNPTTLGGYGITDALALTGGTMTGDIVLKGDPTANLQPATKQYVDTGMNALAGGTGITKTGSTFALTSGVATTGTYKSVTVDTYGRVTAGTNPTTLAGFGITDALALAGGTMTGDIVLKGDPTANLHPASKQYVDNSHNSIFFKDPCRVATTANITLSGTQSIDGVALVAGERVLVKDQTTTAQNGIYTVASGAWTRASDFDNASEVSGAYIPITEGTANGDSLWAMATHGAITIGTTGISFTQMNGLGQVTVGTGITKSGYNLALTSGVATAGTYKSVTVDTYGRVTAGTNPTTVGGYGITDALLKTGDTMTGDLTISKDTARQTFNRPNGGVNQFAGLIAKDNNVTKGMLFWDYTNNKWVYSADGTNFYELYHAGNIESLERSLMAYNKYNSIPDANGIYTVTDYKRPVANTMYAKSTLSNADANGNYQTEVLQYYATDGTTVIKTVTITRTYDANSIMVSEVRS